MKLMKLGFSFLFILLSYTALAHENTQLFVGQNANEDRPAFVLELMSKNFQDHFYISENGEVYLKVDKVFAIPQGIAGVVENNLSNGKSINELVYCKKCGFSYVARPGYRNCPRCGTSN